MLAFGIYSRRYASHPSVLPYQLLMYCAAAWPLTYALELSSHTLQEKILWHNIRFIFLPFLSILELWLVLTFIRRDTWISGWKIFALCTIPSITVLFALTSQYHLFFRHHYQMKDMGDFLVLTMNPGPWYYIHIIYSYSIIILAFLILFFVRNDSHRIFVNQKVFLSLALFVPVIISFTYDAGYTPIPGINPTPALLWLMGIFYSLALFRYRLFDIIPIARSTVIDKMSMPMIVLNADEKIVDMNPAAAMLFENTTTGKIGKKLAAIASDWQELIDFVSSTHQGRQEIVRTGGDHEICYDIRIDRVYSESGVPEGKIILLTDITVQKNLERELRESERRWKSLIEGAPFPIIITRVSDNIIVLVNHRTVEVFKTSADALIGHTTEQFYADRMVRDKIIELLRTKHQIDDILIEMKKSNGEKLWVHASVRKIFYMGEEVYFIAFADISERKMLVDTLRQKNQELLMLSHSLQITNHKLNLLSSITRHDILNHVQIIFLASDFEGQTPSLSELENNMAMIMNAAKSIQQLIQFTAEYQSLGQTKPDWQNLIEILIETLVLRMVSGIAYHIPDTHVFIFADPLLRKVFYNLIENSIRHGGKITSISISFKEETDGGMLVYEDDGFGVPYDEKEKIFHRGVGKNTGLGLFFIREILDITGLSIRECGIPGTGVRFEIHIPEGKYRIETERSGL